MAAEPADYYKLKREPGIVESRPDRVLVRFGSFGPFGSFSGTVLYAQREGLWGCFHVKPNQSASIATASTDPDLDRGGCQV